jgi:Coenzyme PQQ synthesis protein D (PqqD)
MGGREELHWWARPHGDVVARKLDDEMVLVQLETDRIYRLNYTGARFWELLAAGNDREATERRLLEEFDVSAVEVAAEIDVLLTQLGEAGLIEWSE